MERLPVLDLRLLDAASLERLRSAMAALLERPLLDIRREVLQEDRREMDELVLFLAGYARLQASAMAASVAETLAEMVDARLAKSGRVLE